MAVSSFLFRRVALCLLIAGLVVALPAFAQSQPQDDQISPSARGAELTGGETPKIRLEDSEALFDIMAVLNACGYDRDLANSLPVRGQIRDDFAARINASDNSRSDLGAACAFFRDHDSSGSSSNVSRYISLGIELSPPPVLSTRVVEADLPPDASSVLGFVSLVQRLYASAKMHDLWLKYQPAYEAEITRLHDPVSEKIRSTDLYLRMQVGSFLDRSFVVYIEPLAGPGEVNARNYGSDYYLVLSPSAKGDLNLDALRHVYLHYVIDALVEKHGLEISPLQPLLLAVRPAPMDPSYKIDIALLTTECMIRAIEIRTDPRYLPTPQQLKNAQLKRAQGKGEAKEQAKEEIRDLEDSRLELVNAAVAQGFVLTRYFYETLADFEKTGVAGLQDSVGDMLHDINVDREVKFANQAQFAKVATPELLAREKPSVSPLDRAEQQLFAGDPEGASRIAQEVLDKHQGDPGQAYYVLARAASMSGKMTEAQNLFERTLQVASEPRVVAWSHIYLGRIYDLQDNRDEALRNYQAALAAGDPNPNTRTAAQQGMEKQYEKPGKDSN